MSDDDIKEPKIDRDGPWVAKRMEVPDTVWARVLELANYCVNKGSDLLVSDVADCIQEIAEQAYEAGRKDGTEEATKVLHTVAVSREELIKRYPNK